MRPAEERFRAPDPRAKRRAGSFARGFRRTAWRFGSDRKVWRSPRTPPSAVDRPGRPAAGPVSRPVRPQPRSVPCPNRPAPVRNGPCGAAPSARRHAAAHRIRPGPRRDRRLRPRPARTHAGAPIPPAQDREKPLSSTPRGPWHRRCRDWDESGQPPEPGSDGPAWRPGANDSGPGQALPRNVRPRRSGSGSGGVASSPWG